MIGQIELTRTQPLKCVRRIQGGLCALVAVFIPVKQGVANMAVDPSWSGLALPNDSHWYVERITGPADKPGLRIHVRQPTEPFYRLQVGQPLRAGWAEGDRVALSFWGRSLTTNQVRVLVEETREPWTMVAEIWEQWTPTWSWYGVTQRVDRAYRPNELSIRVQAGSRAGEMEIADLRVEQLGPDPRFAAIPALVAPSEVAKRTRRLRQCDLVIEVRDGAGRRVTKARVDVQQQRHAFLFGCNIFLLDPANRDPWQLEYQRRFVALLNFATLPFYWGSYEPSRGQKNEAKLEAMARWCAEQGIAAKGHPICWHEVWPRWAPHSAEETIPLLQARVRDLILRYAQWVRYWDVWNEAIAATAPRHQSTGIADWVRRDGPAVPVMTSLRWAREIAPPGVMLIYNDFDVTVRNERLLRALAVSNTLPDAIGIQSHMHFGRWSAERVWEVTDQFATFGRPIHYTEMTVVSGELAPNAPRKDRYEVGEWPTTPDGEASQAEYVERVYRILFSHPAVEAITWWDFSDRGAWKNAPAGWLRRDMSPKPVYERLMRLIREEWWTAASGQTDSTGSVRLRVWRGTHRVRVEEGDHVVEREIVIPLQGPAEVALTISI